MGVALNRLRKGALWLAGQALAERDRWILWLPVALAAGIFLYFQLDFEPWLASGLSAIALAFVVTAACFHLPPARVFLLGLAAFALGFGLMKLRTDLLAEPILVFKRGPIPIQGVVESVETRGLGARAVIADISSDRWKSGEGVYRARVTFRSGGTENLTPGQRVRALVVLMPPPAPSAPGEYDFGRWAYYRGIGAVGYAFGKAEAVGRQPAGFWSLLGEGTEALRASITARIRKAVPGAEGPIVAALITGERADIPDEDNVAYRDAGLSHILSISGLHLALAGGFFFYILRSLLAAIPFVALNYPIKKWAALAALAGATFYLLISGVSPPAVRSYIMLAVMFVAILVDRPALAMRSVAFAALVLLLLSPESLLDPGFQMSFAAVIALIAYAEWEQARPSPDEKKDWLGKARAYLGGIVITSILAGLATAPFVVFHFDRVSLYGTLSNLLSLPLAGVVIMPAAVASLLSMPLGLEAVPLSVMAAGVRAMTAIAHWVSALPGAAALVPAWPGISLLLVVFGGLWMALWRRKWRWLGAAPVILGLLLTPLASRPDILIGKDAYDVALRLPDGKLFFARLPQDDFTARNWLERDGDGRDPQKAVATRANHIACDSHSCLYRSPKGLIALAAHREALEEDCAQSFLVVAAIPASRKCASPHVIDNLAIRYQGNHAIWLDPYRVETVRQLRGTRPWAVYPKPKPRKPNLPTKARRAVAQ